MDGGLLEGMVIGFGESLVGCSEGSEQFGSPFIFLKEFRGISEIGLVLP